MTLVRNITPEKRAQRELEESEQRSRHLAMKLQHTLDLSLDMIVTIGLDDRFVSISAACERILGYMPGELIGRSYLDFVHPDDHPKTRTERDDLNETGILTVFQNRYLHKQGQIVWLEWNVMLEPGDALLYGVARDVTQRRAAEEDQAFLAAIVQASHNAIVGVGLDDVIRSWNAGAGELYGYTAAQAIGQPMTLIIPSELHSETRLIFHQVSQGERVEAFETVRIARDGRRIPVMITVAAIRNPQGQVIGVAKMMRDITVLQLAQRNIRLLNQTLEQQVRYITGLREIDQAIASSGDLTTSLGLILGNIRQHLGADAATALTLNPHTLTLEYVATRGLHSTMLQGSAVMLTDVLAGRAVLNRQAVSVSDLKTVLLAPDWQQVLRREGVTSYYAAPLIAKGKVIGVIEVMHQRRFMPSEGWLEKLATLLGQASIAVENAQLLQELERSNLELRLAYDETIEGWARALDLRDHETEGHSRRVTEQTVALCQQLGMPPEELVHVRRGALLHDIGKMGIRDAVLLKPGALTDEEWVEMRKHPGYAVALLRPIKFLRPALDIPEYHHEKWDGSGYPLGLRGTDIPVAARAFALVDVYDALTSHRPYRRAWTKERALEHLQSGASTHFDPDLVQIFMQMIHAQAGPEAA
ncbi:PAS domain S-box protein [Deinococcus sp. Arct2-2]|uniref:PAS domain S-box protein n=1 Tax=Deinococcus sp. Arct2-2 TaxID=2568653 RepID=UPI0010A46F92|nr:PAS domain S-box protein [Deinococcus sp. Arct2-2]THF68377.1 PAS domain S-box protein [Deinococcus sp. Arct2-2]